MVFESIVVELVNRFLGDYVENLDKSQLSVSLWGGVSVGSVGLVTAVNYSIVHCMMLSC